MAPSESDNVVTRSTVHAPASSSTRQVVARTATHVRSSTRVNDTVHAPASSSTRQVAARTATHVRSSTRVLSSDARPVVLSSDARPVVLSSDARPVVSLRSNSELGTFLSQTSTPQSTVSIDSTRTTR